MIVRRHAAWAACALALLAHPRPVTGGDPPAPAVVSADEAPRAPIVKRVGLLTITVDPRHGHPGGLFAVRLSSRGRLGAANAILDGRRLRFQRSTRGARALLPVMVTSPPGAATLGVEILARRGRQRVPVDVEVAPRAYAPRGILLPPARVALLQRPVARRDGRRLLAVLRGLGREPLGAERFLAPVDAPHSDSFGGATAYLGAGATVRVEELFDSIAGEYHRGLDYDVPVGTPVRAPAPGRVLLAAALALGGWTVVIDHGESVASAFWHLGNVHVAEGQWLSAGETLGRSGESGLTAFPHLHWGVYVHTVAVDPRVFLAGLGG